MTKPLDEEQMEQVIEDAHRLARKYHSGVRGQTITIWDGIEAYVIRATELAHGILKENEDSSNS
jgi:hypothetical protein